MPVTQSKSASPKPPSSRRKSARRVVQAAAETLREIVLASAPDANIGSRDEIARRLGVGVVTIQQAARILEHEGLLEVRRGPGGGYYGRRPDDAALERAVAAYLRVHGSAFAEVYEVTSLIEAELIAMAARCAAPAQQSALRALTTRVKGCDTAEARVAVEEELRRLLLEIADRPLLRLLGGVTAGLHRDMPPLFPGEEGVAAWKAGRMRILTAVLQQDEELAQFEAMRYRRELLTRLERFQREREAT